MAGIALSLRKGRVAARALVFAGFVVAAAPAVGAEPAKPGTQGPTTPTSSTAQPAPQVPAPKATSAPSASKIKPAAGAKPTATTPATPAATPVNSMVDRGTAYQQFRDHFAARRFSEALPAAEQVVTLTEQHYGADNSELIKPLINVGTTQLRLNNLYGAETAYRRALRIAEAREGGYSRQVIEPLHGLGLAYFAGGQYQNAAVSLRRAVDVSRKLDGLFNVQQLPLVESLVDSYVALDQTSDVDREQQYALRLSENAYGRDDPRMLPVLARNAQWGEATGRYRLSRQAHARTLEILGKTAGKRDPAVVMPLRGIARTYLHEYLYGSAETEERGEFNSGLSGTIGGMPQMSDSRPTRLDSDGEEALKLALTVLADRPDFIGLRGETLLDLGDWYSLSGRPSEAQRSYRDAWAALSGPNGPGTGAMGQPVQLYYRPPSSANKRADKDDDEMTEHSIEVEFTVNEDGRVIEPRTIASDGTDAQEKSVQIAIRRARYRPRYVEGKPVVTTGVRHRQTLYAVIPASRPSA